MEHDFTLIPSLFFTTALLVSLFSVTTCIQITRRNRHLAFEKIIRAKNPPFIWKLARKAAKADSFDILQYFLTGAQQCVRVAIIVVATFFFIFIWSSWSEALLSLPIVSLGIFFLFSAFVSMTLIVCFDFLPRYVSAKYPEIAMKCSMPFTTFALLLFFPFIVLVLKAAQAISGSKILKPLSTAQEQLINVIDELDESSNITEADKRLIQSVFNFKERIAREIMRPRVTLFCLPSSISLKDASSYMQTEEYSRVPVYKDTIDSIIGVVFYKDILSAYITAKEQNEETLLNGSIEQYIKKIHYCPETKKISSLLQEFRKKQIHLAVVVDEYGGTSGLVTIEDILEEIVGEIADEYDDVERYVEKVDDTHWIVDARMNILDLEEETGIKIPQDGEYDTVSGYIFFRLGSIPLVGHVLHHDEYEIKIISCNDRMVEKVEIALINRLETDVHL